MDLKDYREQPDSGLFEGIARRVRRRRLMRMGGAAAGVVAVAAVLCVALWPAGEDNTSQLVAAASPNASVVTHQSSVQPTEEVTATVPTAAEAAPAAKPATLPATLAKEESNMRVNKSEAEGDMTALVPSYTRVATPLTLPAEPQQEIKRICPNDGATIVKREPSEERNEPSASAESTPAKNDPAEEPLPHEDNLFWAPNIIIPAGDVDDNRTFFMRFTSEVTQFHVYIFNRAGHQVFQSSDPSFVWDGTSKGTLLPQGAYVWAMRFRDSSGKLREAHGSVTLIR